MVTYGLLMVAYGIDVAFWILSTIFVLMATLFGLYLLYVPKETNNFTKTKGYKIGNRPALTNHYVAVRKIKFK